MVAEGAGLPAALGSPEGLLMGATLAAWLLRPPCRKASPGTTLADSTTWPASAPLPSTMRTQSMVLPCSQRRQEDGTKLERKREEWCGASVARASHSAATRCSSATWTVPVARGCVPLTSCTITVPRGASGGRRIEPGVWIPPVGVSVVHAPWSPTAIANMVQESKSVDIVSKFGPMSERNEFGEQLH